jgi:hypothetical protein
MSEVAGNHRWARLQKQPSSITVCQLPTKDKKNSFFICANKRETEAQAIFLNPFTDSSSGKQKFVICPLMKKQTEVIRLQTV